MWTAKPAGGTDLPLTSNGSSPQHFALICQLIPLPDDCYMLEVYPVLTFAGSGGALLAHNELTDAGKAELVSLPKLSFQHRLMPSEHRLISETG